MSKKLFYEAPECELMEFRLERTILSNYRSTAEGMLYDDDDEW